MSFYIILRGPAGAGKTTIAERLAQIYDGHHINIDKVKKELGLKHSEEEKLEANKVVIKDARRCLEQGKVVIFDEVMYYETQLDQLKNLPHDRFVFSLVVPLDTCLERNRKRVREGGRKTTDDAIKLVYELVSKLKDGIEISTHNKPVEESVKEIVSYLPERLP